MSAVLSSVDSLPFPLTSHSRSLPVLRKELPVTIDHAERGAYFDKVMDPAAVLITLKT
jgi:hypothetical protein